MFRCLNVKKWWWYIRNNEIIFNKIKIIKRNKLIICRGVCECFFCWWCEWLDIVIF